MKRVVYVLLLCFAAACQENAAVEVPEDEMAVMPAGPVPVKGQMLVKFGRLESDMKITVTRSGEVETGNQAFDAAARRIGAVRMERVFPPAGKFEARTRKAGLHLWYRVHFDERLPLEEAEKILSALPEVAVTEAVTEIVPESVNDPFFPQQWFLHNDGSIPRSRAGADVRAPEAWAIEPGKPEVIVAVSDANIDFTQEDLVDNLWQNTKEMDGSGDFWEDKDGNGYEGDWYGIGKMGGRTVGCNPYAGIEPSDHGTHVAGIIAAKRNNGKGVCSVAGGDSKNNGVRFMCVPMGEEGIKYAADNGAVIVNCSWGAYGKAPKSLEEAIAYFVRYAGTDENGRQTGPMRGGLVFASAGNEGKESGDHYPSCLEHVMAVASVRPDYIKSGFSNYADWVDICAPGGGDGEGWQVVSTVSRNEYGSMVGTSQAAPVAAGVAALIVSKFGGKDSGLEPYDVEFRLLRGANRDIYDFNPEYVGKLGAGYVNAEQALSDEAVNYPPEIRCERDLSKQMIVGYGESEVLEFTVSDRESASDELDYEVEDGSGAVSHAKAGDRITLTVSNTKACKPGDYCIKLKVTDQGGVSSERSFPLKLHPEFLKEPEVQSCVTDELLIRAGMTFSGRMKAEFYDAAGRLVYTQEVEASLSRPGKVDCSGLAGGVYTLKLTCNNKTITRNIIKL